MIASRGVIISDTSPLFTLALADALDVLIRPGLPLFIPDAVYFEAIRVRGAPGADRIAEWIRDTPLARVIPTAVGIDQLRRVEDGRSIRGLGEQATLEELDRQLRSDPTLGVVLLFEDNDIEKRRAFMEDRVELISTGDFLRELEAAGLIQSAEVVLDAAAAQGRNVDRLRRMRSAQ